MSAAEPKPSGDQTQHPQPRTRTSNKPSTTQENEHRKTHPPRHPQPDQTTKDTLGTATFGVVFMGKLENDGRFRQHPQNQNSFIEGAMKSLCFSAISTTFALAISTSAFAEARYTATSCAVYGNNATGCDECFDGGAKRTGGERGRIRRAAQGSANSGPGEE
jgi:hypothetical protein